MPEVVDENKHPISDSTANKELDSPTLAKKPRVSAATTDAESPTLKFTRITAVAHPPTYGSGGAAGADLYSSEQCVVPARGKYLVSTGICVALPNGHYGRIAPRSGLASKHSIDVGAGVVDGDYRGEVKVLLFNFSDVDFQVNVGDRIAQFICERYTRAELEEVDSLDETGRGAGGFGSTGVGSNVVV